MFWPQFQHPIPSPCTEENQLFSPPPSPYFFSFWKAWFSPCLLSSKSHWFEIGKLNMLRSVAALSHIVRQRRLNQNRLLSQEYQRWGSSFSHGKGSCCVHVYNFRPRPAPVESTLDSFAVVLDSDFRKQCVLGPGQGSTREFHNNMSHSKDNARCTSGST